MPTLVNKYIDSPIFGTATAVFDDINLTNKSVDGIYQYNGEYRNQLNGLLGPLIICETCGIPCGTNINPPGGGQGVYQLEFDAGTTASDTGAILIYFDPQSVPDGIRVLFNGVWYNTLTSPTNGYRRSTSGVPSSFTMLGNVSNNCLPSLPNTTAYTFYDGFSLGTWDVGSPSPQNFTLNTGDYVGGGLNEFNLLVIPKTTATPGIVQVQVLGPCDNTAWNISVSCPQALPLFQATAVGSSTSCVAATTTFYFARFQNQGNAFPELNNFVYSDHDGANPVSNQNYVMDNNTVITTVNGVVTAVNSCT